MPNSTAAQQAATLIAAYPATPAATTRRIDPIPDRHATRRYDAYATREPTIAMLKQLAPSAVMPPSPKKAAWMVSAMERARIEAQGPRTIAATPIPTAWPVV